jgi:hypothetical protein
MNFKKSLDSAYEEKTKGLYQRMENISNRLALLMVTPEDKETVEAKIAVKRRQREEALAAGDQGLALNLEKEIQGIGDKLQTQSEEISALSAERDEIQAKFDLAADQTLRKVFPEIQQQVLLAWIHAIEDAERGWEDLQQFGVEHELKLSFHVHHGGLSPRGDKSLRNRLEQWVD